MGWDELQRITRKARRSMVLTGTSREDGSGLCPDTESVTHLFALILDNCVHKATDGRASPVTATGWRPWGQVGRYGGCMMPPY